jgi:hypothetical protein
MKLSKKLIAVPAIAGITAALGLGLGLGAVAASASAARPAITNISGTKLGSMYCTETPNHKQLTLSVDGTIGSWPHYTCGIYQLFPLYQNRFEAVAPNGVHVSFNLP